MYIKYLTYIYVDMIYVCIDTIYNTYIGEHPRTMEDTNIHTNTDSIEQLAIQSTTNGVVGTVPVKGETAGGIELKSPENNVIKIKGRRGKVTLEWVKGAIAAYEKAKAEKKMLVIGTKKIRKYYDIKGYGAYVCYVNRKRRVGEKSGLLLKRDRIKKMQELCAEMGKTANEALKDVVANRIPREAPVQGELVEAGKLPPQMRKRQEKLDREAAGDILDKKKLEEGAKNEADTPYHSGEYQKSVQNSKNEAVQDVIKDFNIINPNVGCIPWAERRAREIRLVEDHPEQYAAIFRSSFIHFIAFWHRYIHNEEFDFQPHHIQLCEALSRRVLTKKPLKKPNLLINISPRAGKTQIIKYFSAWGYTHNAACNYIVTACDDKLAQDTSSEVKQIVGCELFQRVFGLKLDKSTKSKEFWKTEQGGCFRAAPLRGGIVGYGAGVIRDVWGGCMIIDDTLKPQDANSETANNEVYDIFQNTLKSRRNNKSGKFKTPIIFIGQRLSVLDLAARIKETEPEDWEMIIVPALKPDGTSYWEKQISTEELLKMKDTNPFLFYAQYQQEPIAKGGMLIKSEWFKYYQYYLLPSMKKVFMVADTAYTTGKFSDYTAVGLFGVGIDNKLYFMDLLHIKEEQERMKQKIEEFWTKHKTNPFWKGARLSCLVVEKRGTGITLIQDLKRAGSPVREISSPKSKGQRAQECCEYFINGQLMLPECDTNPISKVFLNEAINFSDDPKTQRHKHDDVLDVAMYAIEFGLMTKRGLF